jgi:hypothetical protein
LPLSTAVAHEVNGLLSLLLRCARSGGREAGLNEVADATD